MPPTGLADGFGRGSALRRAPTRARRFTPENLGPRFRWIANSAAASSSRTRMSVLVRRGLGNTEDVTRHEVLPGVRPESSKVSEPHRKVQVRFAVRQQNPLWRRRLRAQFFTFPGPGTGFAKTPETSDAHPAMSRYGRRSRGPTQECKLSHLRYLWVDIYLLRNRGIRRGEPLSRRCRSVDRTVRCSEEPLGMASGRRVRT
jgi:hypothetical protein